MTHKQNQREQAARLAARRAVSRAEQSAAQAARLARLISAQAEADERHESWTTFGPDHIGTARIANALDVAKITGGSPR